MLGDAYLRILNPEQAIDALQQAYALDPENSRLRARIGRALVATHEYHRAVDFYEKSIKQLNLTLSQALAASGGDRATGGRRKALTGSAKYADLAHLSHDLAKLYIKLGQEKV